MPYIIIPLISLVLVFGGLFGVYNYVPLSTIESLSFSEPSFGTSLTTINGSDTLSASRTVINNNFTALNSGKIEVSTSSVASITTLLNLTSVGTIGTGVWNATAIAVNKGGSGTTTPSVWQVVLGNGSNGFTVASGTGALGQFLTSNGAGAFPTWQTSSVNQGDSYTWTGAHNFLGETYFKYLNASSTLNLNGIDLSFPSTQGASSTALLNDGSGNLNWQKIITQRYTIASSTGVSCTTTNCTATTSVAIAIPANTLTASSTIDVVVGAYASSGAGGTGECTVSLRNSSGTTFSSNSFSAASLNTIDGTIRFQILANNSVSSQNTYMSSYLLGPVGSSQSFNSSVNNTSIDISTGLSLVFNVLGGATDVTNCSVQDFSIIVNP